MHRTTQRLPIPSKELLELQGELAPYGSTLWQGDAGDILVARVPTRDPDLVNDVERIAEWATPSHVVQAQHCLLLTPREVHVLPMAPIRSHVERRIAMDRRQAGLLRDQLPAGLSWKLYRAIDDPYRRVRLGVLFPEERMRDVDDDRLDELAAKMGSLLDGGFDDVHCVHLVAAVDDVRLTPEQFLADLGPRFHDEHRRVEAQQRLLRMQQEDARARGQETASLRSHLTGGAGTARAPVKRRTDRGVAEDLDWEMNPRKQEMYSRIDALGGSGTVATYSSEAALPTDVMSRMRRHLMDAGYELRIRPPVPGHAIDLAAERSGDPPERILVWNVPRMDRDVAERALAAVRDMKVGLGVVVAPEADADGQRTLVATRVQWLPPERIEELRL